MKELSKLLICLFFVGCWSSTSESSRQIYYHAVILTTEKIDESRPGLYDPGNPIEFYFTVRGKDSLGFYKEKVRIEVTEEMYKTYEIGDTLRNYKTRWSQFE